MNFFFSHRPGFSNFSFLFPHFPYVYYVKCRIRPFPHKKNTIFHSVHAFTHIRQHYFSKHWGGTNAWAVPPPQVLGGPSPPPPSSPSDKLRTCLQSNILRPHTINLLRNDNSVQGIHSKTELHPYNEVPVSAV